MALKIRSFPKLKGEAAKEFLKRSEKVSRGISDKEKKEIQDSLRAAIDFFTSDSSLPRRTSK